LGVAPCERDQNEHGQGEHDHVLPARSDSHAQIVTPYRGIRFLRCGPRFFVSAVANARKSRAAKVQFHLP
jgi:hypothetical protein